MRQILTCSVTIALLVALALSVAQPQPEPTMPPLEALDEEPAIPKRVKALAADTDVEGTLRAAKFQAWYVVDLSDPGDAKSLLVELEIHAESRGDVDLKVVGADGNDIASSSGTTDRELCLLPIEGLDRVLVRVFLYGDPEKLRNDRALAEYTLRVELTPRESVSGLGAFVDDLTPLKDGDPLSGRLPARGSPTPDRRVYSIDLAGMEATVARIKMEIANPDERDIDLAVFDENGEDLGSSTGTEAHEACFVPLEGYRRLFVAAFLAGGAEGPPGRYELALTLSDEEPGLIVLERVGLAEAKEFTPGQRVLGQVTEDREELFAWLRLDEASGVVVLNPAQADTKPRLVVRNSEGWVVGEPTEADGLPRVVVDATQESYFLVQVTADKPGGFSLCAIAGGPEVSFDPGTAKPLVPGQQASGKVGGDGGSVAVFSLQAPISAELPKVTLKADPIFADLDLFVCAAPDVVLAYSDTVGGMEAVEVPLGGAVPVYVVVKAPEGVSAEFEVSAE